MAPKPKLTDDELLAQFDTLGGDDEASTPQAIKPPKITKAKPIEDEDEDDDDDDEEEDDPLAELENLAKAPRTSTPKVASSTATSTTRSQRGINTPTSSSSARTSEDKPNLPRKSGESTRSIHQSFTATTDDSTVEQRPATSASEKQQGGGGWWGSVFATASAAVKQAEAAYKEIQKNEEAQKWADQVRGNVGALREIGDGLRSRALPTFTNILHTIAPPISQHERLQIHITHDLKGYPSLDPIIYQTFSRVMSQVEGGDLMVIQRGSESTQRRDTESGYRGTGTSGWGDGPWWRHHEPRDIGAVKGLVAGTKLVRVSAETYANDFYSAKGGLEQAAKQATETLSEESPVRDSDIFVAIQAISHIPSADIFSAPPEDKKDAIEDFKETELSFFITFAIYLHDPVHNITFSTLTQEFPQQWADWLDAPVGENQLPPEILNIIESGGVDPREWVAEWIEELLSLGIGVVAQRYVAKRMGVGEGGLGRARARQQEVLESNGGEAARAGII